MAAFASLPLFTDAWVADTKHLTRLARGTYHDLLVLIWRSPECRVPNDDAWLAPRLAMTIEEVAAELRPIIAEFCRSDGNWITQKRLRKEWDYCNKKREQQSVSAKARWNKDKKSRNAMPPGIAPTPSPTKKEGAPSAPSTNPEKELFERGREVLGKRAGGLIAKLLKAHRGSIAQTKTTIERAAEKHSPVEYVAAIINALANNRPLTAAGNLWPEGIT